MSNEEIKAIRVYKAAARKATQLTKKSDALNTQAAEAQKAAWAASETARRLAGDLTALLRGDRA